MFSVLQIYGYSWIVLVAIVLLFKVCVKIFISFFSSPDLMFSFQTYSLTYYHCLFSRGLEISIILAG
ncbi:unnamed protein product, partial [Arabidopsis halleri]